MKRNTKFFLVLICALLLFACGKNAEKGGRKVTYQIGFPTEDSPELSEFLRSDIWGYQAILLSEEEETFIYSERNMNVNENKINYFQHTLSQLKEYYEPVFSDHPNKVLYNLFHQEKQKKMNLHHEIDSEEEKTLPDVTLEKGDVLRMKINGKDISFSISEKLVKSMPDELIMNIEEANESGFILHLKDEKTREVYYFFALNDLSEMDIFQDTELADAIEQEKLKPYYPILKKINESLSFIDYKVIHTKTHEVFKVENQHFLSKDCKYIYLNGEDTPLDEGVQQIQRVEDYVKGNDRYYAEFELNYEEISNKLDYKSVGIGLANIVYFNEDFVVLHLEFDAAITGTAGSTNVIIDLQEDRENPTYYLVDLGLH